MGSHDFLWYLAVLSCRSLGLACVAWLALRVFRVKSSSVKHAVWTVVTAVMLLQVVASPALPSVPLRVLAPAPDAGPTLTSSTRIPAGTRSSFELAWTASRVHVEGGCHWHLCGGGLRPPGSADFRIHVCSKAGAQQQTGLRAPSAGIRIDFRSHDGGTNRASDPSADRLARVGLGQASSRAGPRGSSRSPGGLGDRRDGSHQLLHLLVSSAGLVAEARACALGGIRLRRFGARADGRPGPVRADLARNSVCDEVRSRTVIAGRGAHGKGDQREKKNGADSRRYEIHSAGFRSTRLGNVADVQPCLWDISRPRFSSRRRRPDLWCPWPSR